MAESYTTARKFSALFQDGIRQFRALRGMKLDAPRFAERILGELARLRSDAENDLQMSMHNLDILEIGHGQLQATLAYYTSLGNRATGIDLDVVPRGLLDFSTLWFQLRTNGVLRLVKTIGREATGVSSAFRKEICRQAGWKSWPKYKALWMNASKMTFPDHSFDLTTSWDVFEHVDDPAAVLKELYRVTKPGGGAHLMFLHYLNSNALHDLREITQSANAPLPWAHLIPELKHTVSQGAYVNHLRIGDWAKLASEILPGSKVEGVPDPRNSLREQLASHRKQGHLSEYPDEELLAVRVKLTWRKPK